MTSNIDLFLSYSHKDLELAKELYDGFTDAGLQCFISEKDISASEQWEDKIREAIHKSKRILLLITPRSINSHWVLLESGAAWVLKKNLVPALAYVKPEELPDPIRSCQARLVETKNQIQMLIEELVEDQNTYIMHKDRHMITSRQIKSATRFSSSFLMSSQGTLATWIYLHQFGKGIRDLRNNRHIFAHDTNLGHPPYKNVFSLSRGPETSYNPPKDPVWKLWLVNAAGQARTWVKVDGTELSTGWHHFAVRWDHRQPVLEFLIDGNLEISANDFLDYWPGEFDKEAFLGSWQSLDTMHFIETHVCRFIADSRYLDDSWIQQEQQQFRGLNGSKERS